MIREVSKIKYVYELLTPRIRGAIMSMPETISGIAFKLPQMILKLSISEHFRTLFTAFTVR